MQMGEELRAWLPAGGFGESLYAFASVESTNTVAARLAGDGAPEGTLVVADRQTRGRGRHGSRWETPAVSAVAMSLILRPGVDHPLRWAGLGALAVADSLEREGLAPTIKWPNDVLLEGRKVAGVLAEAAWEGDRLAYLILGIGVNVARGSVPRRVVTFPATCIEEHSPRPISRAQLIAGIVPSVEGWLPRLASKDFLAAWESRLAYRNQRVRVQLAEGVLEGNLLGLGPQGEARLGLDGGGVAMCSGEARWLRPVTG